VVILIEFYMIVVYDVMWNDNCILFSYVYMFLWCWENHVRFWLTKENEERWKCEFDWKDCFWSCSWWCEIYNYFYVVPLWRVNIILHCCA